MWVLKTVSGNHPPSWAGFKFFNVYGPNEYHKGRMASVIFHTARQIKATGGMKLFRSHRPDFRDGEQSRDFIYVKDVVDVLEDLVVVLALVRPGRVVAGVERQPQAVDLLAQRDGLLRRFKCFLRGYINRGGLCRLRGGVRGAGLASDEEDGHKSAANDPINGPQNHLL